MTTDPPEPKPRRKWHFYKWLVLLIVATFAYAQWRAYTFRSALKEAYALGWQLNNTKPLDLIYDDWKNAFKKDTWFDGVTWMSVPSGKELEKHRAMIQQLNPKHLTVGKCQSLRDLSALKGHTRLKTLHIEFASSLTNLDALQNLTALEHIRISDVAALTNVDGLKNLLAVEVIILTGTAKLTNVDALKNLRRLNRVELWNCTALTNVDALKNLTALERVNLGGCTGLTNVDALMHLPALSMVRITGCTGLTKESIAALKAAHPKAEIWAD